MIPAPGEGVRLESDRSGVRLCRDFSGLSRASDLNIGTPGLVLVGLVSVYCDRVT